MLSKILHTCIFMSVMFIIYLYNTFFNSVICFVIFIIFSLCMWFLVWYAVYGVTLIVFLIANDSRCEFIATTSCIFMILLASVFS